MALSAFDDPEHPPTRDELAAVLGPATPHWDAIVVGVQERTDQVAEVWRHGGARYGWTLRLVRRDRVLVYLTPQAGAVLVGVVLGERAIAAARADGSASEATLALVDAAPRYAEGRGIRLPVADDADLAVALELAAIKLVR